MILWIRIKKAIRELFVRPFTWQSWLEVEAALAKVQEALKNIPEEAAEAVRAKADIVHFDVDELSADINRTNSHGPAGPQ